MNTLSNQELRARARAVLENNLFSNSWLMALLCAIIPTAIISGLTALLPGLGFGISLILSGPLFYGLAFVFLRRARNGIAMNPQELFRGFQEDFGGTLLLHILDSRNSTLGRHYI